MVRMRLAIALACLALAFPGGAKTFRWSSQGDYLSADPHAQNEGLNNALNDAIFERLTARAKDLSLVPSLATSWEARSSTVWRFHLRRGVLFHDGSPMTADDVVFSIDRAKLPSSNFKVFATPTGKARKVDDFTVEIETPAPIPAAVLLGNVNAVRIMNRARRENNGGGTPQDFIT